MKERLRNFQKVNRALIQPTRLTLINIFILLRYAKNAYGRAWRKEIP